jgi:hypothetical protein
MASTFFPGNRFGAKGLGARDGINLFAIGRALSLASPVSYG